MTTKSISIYDNNIENYTIKLQVDNYINLIRLVSKKDLYKIITQNNLLNIDYTN